MEGKKRVGGTRKYKRQELVGATKHRGAGKKSKDIILHSIEAIGGLSRG